MINHIENTINSLSYECVYGKGLFSRTDHIYLKKERKINYVLYNRRKNKTLSRLHVRFIMYILGIGKLKASRLNCFY